MRAGLAVPGKIGIRPTKAEVGTAIDRADREGWNTYLSDGEGCNTFGPAGVLCGAPRRSPDEVRSVSCDFGQKIVNTNALNAISRHLRMGEMNPSIFYSGRQQYAGNVLNEMTSLFGMPLEKGRWVLVILGLIINLFLGSIYAWSVFVEPLTEYFTKLGQAVTANEVLMPFSIYLVFLAITMPFTGRIIERYGPRNMAILGGGLVGLGWILGSFSPSALMLSVLYGVVGGIGEGIIYSVLVAVAACWFPDRRGLAVGITILGIGFSAFFTANIAGSLIGAYGVMNTFRIFGIGIIGLVLLLAQPFTFPTPGWAPRGCTSPVMKFGEGALCECNRSHMLQSSSFYGLWACYFLGCLAGLMAISITEPVGAEVGIEAGLATFLVGFFAIFNGVGRPFFGALTDLGTPRNAAILSFILIAMASFLMWQIPIVPVYILSFAVLWGCLGGWLAIAPTTTGNFYGTCDYPRCYGVVFLAYGAGAIAGPQLAGFIKVSTQSYMGVFPYVLALALAGIFIAFTMMKPPTLGSCGFQAGGKPPVPEINE